MANEVIVFVDAAELVIAYLEAELDDRGYFGIHVGARVPKPRPATFVRVERAGGVRVDLVRDSATLIVEAWADRADRAMTLAQLCRALVHALEGTDVDGVTVYRVGEFAGPASLPDPETDQARATQTLTIETRGTAA